MLLIKGKVIHELKIIEQKWTVTTVQILSRAGSPCPYSTCGVTKEVDHIQKSRFKHCLALVTDKDVTLQVMSIMNPCVLLPEFTNGSITTLKIILSLNFPCRHVLRLERDMHDALPICRTLFSIITRGWELNAIFMALSYTICINLYVSHLYHLIIIIEESGVVIKVVASDRWEVKCFFPTESRAELGTSELRYPPAFCFLAAVVCVFISCWSISSVHSLIQSNMGTPSCQGPRASVNFQP